MSLSTLCWTRWGTTTASKAPQIGHHFRNFALLLGNHSSRRTPLNFRMIFNGPNTSAMKSCRGGYVLRQFIIGKRKIYTTALKLKNDPSNQVVPVAKNLPKTKVSKKEFSRLMSLAKSEKWTLTG